MRYTFALGTVAVLTVGFGGTVAGQKTGDDVTLQGQDTDAIEITFSDAANRRVRLGINVSFEPRPTDSLGALIEAVTPGGPADKAGIRSGDVITKLDGRAVGSATGNNKSPGMYLVSLIARLEPNAMIPVELRRGSAQKKVSVVPASGNTAFTVVGSLFLGASPLASLETVPLNPDLGHYFGVTEGMLVINTPADSNLGLKGGDVILSVDGRKPSDAGHLMGLMRRDTGGQPLKLKVMRHNKRITVTVRLAPITRMTTGR